MFRPKSSLLWSKSGGLKKALRMEEFQKYFCVLSTYPKKPFRTEKPFIFNFRYVKEVWDCGLLGVKMCHWIRFPMIKFSFSEKAKKICLEVLTLMSKPWGRFRSIFFGLLRKAELYLLVLTWVTSIFTRFFIKVEEQHLLSFVTSSCNSRTLNHWPEIEHG